MGPKNKKAKLVSAEDLADIDASNSAASNGAAGALDAPSSPEVANIPEAGSEAGNEAGKEMGMDETPSEPQTMEEIEETIKIADGSRVVHSAPSPVLEGQADKAGQAGSSSKRAMTAEELRAEAERREEAEQGGALAMRLQEEEEEKARSKTPAKTNELETYKKPGSALKPMPTVLKQLVHQDVEEEEEEEEEEYNPYEKMNEGQLSAERKKLLAKIAKLEDQLKAEKNPLIHVDATRKLAELDDGVVPLANALVDVLAILQQHAEFMDDYSMDTKGLAWFVSILADYYYETPKNIKEMKEKLAQVKELLDAKQEARIKAAAKRYEDRLRKQEEDAEKEGKDRTRKRSSQSSVCNDADFVTVTPEARAFFDENREEFQANGYETLDRVNPQVFKRDKVTKKVLELLLASFQRDDEDDA